MSKLSKLHSWSYKNTFNLKQTGFSIFYTFFVVSYLSGEDFDSRHIQDKLEISQKLSSKCHKFSKMHSWRYEMHLT